MMAPILKIRLLGYQIHSFHFWGVTGFVVGVALGIALTLHEGLPLWVLGLLSLLGAATLLALALLQKVLTGQEELVYYRHEIAILAVCALTLWAIGQPIIPFLEITLLGVGTFLAFGRIGCYNVGCCHGRPWTVGAMYSEEHARKGFPRYLVGLPIFPVPLVESFFVGTTVLTCAWLVIYDFPAGAAIVWYTVLYGWVRFLLEFLRGDTERLYWLGFSEAQWTTFGLFLISIWASIFGFLPYYTWHLWAVIAMAACMISISILLRLQLLVVYEIYKPSHIREVAQGLYKIEHDTIKSANKHIANTGIKQPPPISCTTLGFNISSGVTSMEDGIRAHYTISKKEHSKDKSTLQMNRSTATELGNLIRILRHREYRFEVRDAGQKGIYHIIFSHSRSAY